MMSEEIKNYIRRVRREEGLSRKAFGAAIGKTNRTIESWENGLRFPQAATLELIEKKYNCKRE